MSEMGANVSSSFAVGLALDSIDLHKLCNSEESCANIVSVFSGTVTFHSSRYKEIGLKVSSINFEWL
jgi:hypothetical protein